MPTFVCQVCGFGHNSRKGFQVALPAALGCYPPLLMPLPVPANRLLPFPDMQEKRSGGLKI